MPLLIPIFSALAAGFGFITKHPIVLKMMFFPFFITIIIYAVSFFVDWLKPMITGSTALGYVAYLGILDGLSIYLSIITTGFLVRQVLRFISS